MNGKYYRAFSLAVGLFVGLQGTCVHAEEHGRDKQYLMGVGAPGSASYNIGIGLSSVIKLVLVPEGGADLAAIPTEGNYRSLQKIIDNSAQLAIVDSVSAQQARDGTGRFEGLGLGDQLTVVAALWHDVDHFILANDHARSGTIGDLAILSGDEFATDLASHQAAREMMAHFGSPIDNDEGSFWSEWETPLRAFDRGELAGFVVTGPPSSSDVLHILKQLDGRAQLLEFSRRQMAKIGDGWHAHALMPDIYPGLATQIDTAARTVMLVAHADVSEEAVYQFVKIIFENLPYLAGMDDVAGHISLDHAQQEINLPVHPGAARYYQDVDAWPQGSGDLVAEPQSDKPDMHANHAGHGDTHKSADQHASHGKQGLGEHVHDLAMLTRARAEIHDNEEVLKIGRPPVLRHPETEIFNVYFGLGKTDPADADLAKIEMITDLIMTFREKMGREPEVYVEGHTDSTGSWKTNYEIAHRRARSIQDRLVAEGVPSSWIHISDYSEQGLAIPTADGVAEERNRRVEITVIPQD